MRQMMGLCIIRILPRSLCVINNLLLFCFFAVCCFLDIQGECYVPRSGTRSDPTLLAVATEPGVNRSSLPGSRVPLDAAGTSPAATTTARKAAITKPIVDRSCSCARTSLNRSPATASAAAAGSILR